MPPRTAEGGTEPGRRRFLVSLGLLPLALPAAWSALAACAREESGGPEGGGGTAQSGSAQKPPPEPARQPGGEASGGGREASQPAAAAGVKEPSAGDPLVTEVEAMKPTVQALQYVNESQQADERCSNCQFYTPKTDVRGGCELFRQGLVTAGGWCASWTAPVDA